ncbi:hypothetical protein ACP4OV_006205 [Aristida adscensionis]
MGSCASSLRGVRPAVIAVVFLVLILAAGAIGALRPDQVPAFQQATPPPRKQLGVRRRRPPGSKLLPRGVMQRTTNLEMEASLSGDPERRTRQPPAPKKSLLAVPVGIANKAVVGRMVSKFVDAGFSVVLFHYDGTVEQWADMEWSDRVVHVVARKQTKWWFAKRFLHPDVVAEYEFIFLWDEDIEVDDFHPARYVEIARTEGLEVSQPALDRRSQIHHAITARPLVPTGDTHRRAQSTRCNANSKGPPCAGWVEMMVPVFSRAAWRCTWELVQNDLIHGWGLDYKLGYCAKGDRARAVGVVDSEYVLHRGQSMLGDGAKATDSSGRGAVRWRSFKEMMMFNKRWAEAAAKDKSWLDPYAEQPTAGSK